MIFPPGRAPAALAPAAAPIRTTRLRPALAWAALVLMLCCLLAAPQARANITRPKSKHSPSAALDAPGAGLTVLGEELNLICGAQGCQVRAVYRIRAEAAGRWRMAMVLPQPGVVKVRSGGPPLEVASKPVAWPDPQPEYDGPAKMPREHWLPVMHQAAFELDLPAGSRVLEVYYRQDWGLEEREFGGYFSGWLSVRTLRYELWPLAGWQQAPGFALKLTVRVEDPEAEAALLRAAPDLHGLPANLALIKRSGTGVFTFKRTWGAVFPARLELVVGEREAVATYGVQPPQPSELHQGEW